MDLDNLITCMIISWWSHQGLRHLPHCSLRCILQVPNEPHEQTSPKHVDTNLNSFPLCQDIWHPMKRRNKNRKEKKRILNNYQLLYSARSWFYLLHFTMCHAPNTERTSALINTQFRLEFYRSSLRATTSSLAAGLIHRGVLRSSFAVQMHCLNH